MCVSDLIIRYKDNGTQDKTPSYGPVRDKSDGNNSTGTPDDYNLKTVQRKNNNKSGYYNVKTK